VYYVRVRAENAYGDSDPTPDLVLVPPGAPGAPNTLVASRVNATVNLRWNAPSGSSVTGYIIEAGSEPGLSDLARIQVGPGTTFSAVAPAGTYFIRVRALNSRGPGLPSNEVTVR
jgi:Fibronectin type III domain